MKRRRSARTARWFAVYTLVMLAVAVSTLAAGELSVGFTVLATAVVFALLAWYAWRRARPPAG